jgi:hypothetical protein
MCLTIEDRINGIRNRVVKLYTENANEHNQSIDPTTPETDEGSSTVVTLVAEILTGRARSQQRPAPPMLQAEVIAQRSEDQ